MQVFLETERMVLRRFTATDVDHLVDLDSDPEVMRFLTGGRPTPREVIQHDILPAFLRSYEPSSGLGVFAAIEKESGEFLGWFGFRPKDAGNPKEVTLGYRLRRAVWGQGYATEGTRALIRKGFTELGVQRVVATTYQDNLASRRVMEKAGLSLVRTYRMTVAELLANDTTSHDPPSEASESRLKRQTMPSEASEPDEGPKRPDQLQTLDEVLKYFKADHDAIIASYLRLARTKGHDMVLRADIMKDLGWDNYRQRIVKLVCDHYRMAMPKGQ